MKSTHLITAVSKHKYLLIIVCLFFVAAAASIASTRSGPTFNPADQTQLTTTAPALPPPPWRAVRVDLSSLPTSDNPAGLRREIISQLSRVNANTVYLNPWSDGYANYRSQLAPLGPLGQVDWLETFIDEAHAANLQVWAWFVVGKDNFPADLHPSWYARTINRQPYRHADAPGVNLPFASLANQEYLDYHLSVVREVNRLPIDGWVISEPLIGWGDKHDDFYTDFSPAALALYRQQGINFPAQVVKRARYSSRAPNQDLYRQLTDARADIVTNFVAQTMQLIRQDNPRPITLTLFTEPDQNGNLTPFSDLKEWLGTDINQLAQLNPDAIEIQSLFLDFAYPQPAAWTASLIKQFKQQLNRDIPIAVSVQGFDSQQPLIPADFATALSTAINEAVAGTSFYAYHTLKPEHWQQLSTIWQTN